MEFSREDELEFQIEARDLLNQAEEALLSLEKCGDFRRGFDAVFRGFHSLKGAAGMFGLPALQALLHRLENELSLFRSSGKLPVDSIEHFLQGVDQARALLAGQPAAPTETKNTNLVDTERQFVKKSESALRVFVLDDEPDIASMLSGILEGCGFSVRSFCEPREMLSQLLPAAPDLLLTDIKMPGMNGLEVLAAAKKIFPDLNVILVSGHVSKEVLLESHRLGAFAVLEKPFVENDIISISQIALERSNAAKLLNRSINLLLYQFSDIDEALRGNQKVDVANLVRVELETLLHARRTLRRRAP